MTEETVIDRKSVENYLNTTVKKFTDRRTSSRNTSLIGSQLVEEINKNLPENCPSVENFKFIVHATVQVTNFKKKLVRPVSIVSAFSAIDKAGLLETEMRIVQDLRHLFEQQLRS